MGVFDMFSKDGREQRAREKNASRAINKYAQSPDRMKALQSLRDDGSPDALFALMRRFGMMYDKSIEDEQEKEWVFEVLVEKGATALAPLKRYLQAAESISWPLRLLEKIVSTKEQQIDVVEEELSRHEPGYERDPTKKIQLLNHLGGMRHVRVPPLVIPYFSDMDEGVRYAVVEALLRQADEALARDPLIEHFASDKEDSLRLRLRIADGFAELGWSVADRREEVQKRLPDAYQIETAGKIKKKTGAKE
jgi:HEAT repeat protein